MNSFHSQLMEENKRSSGHSMIFDKLEQKRATITRNACSGHSMIFDKLELLPNKPRHEHCSGHSMIFDKLEQ